MVRRSLVGTALLIALGVVWPSGPGAVYANAVFGLTSALSPPEIGIRLEDASLYFTYAKPLPEEGVYHVADIGYHTYPLHFGLLFLGMVIVLTPTTPLLRRLWRLSVLVGTMAIGHSVALAAIAWALDAWTNGLVPANVAEALVGPAFAATLTVPPVAVASWWYLRYWWGLGVRQAPLSAVSA